MDLFGDEGGAVVDLRHDLGEQELGGDVPHSLPEQLATVEHLAAAHYQHHHRGVARRDVDAVDVDVFAGDRGELAAPADRLDLGQGVPQLRGALVVGGFGGLPLLALVRGDV